jgi:DNA-binding transcriptional MerR regulator
MTQLIENKDIILKSGDVERLVGCSHDELTYLRRRGLVKPVRTEKSRGSDCKYGIRQLFELILIQQLRKIGIDTIEIKNILDNGEKELSALWEQVPRISSLEDDSKYGAWIEIRRRKGDIYKISAFFSKEPPTLLKNSWDLVTPFSRIFIYLKNYLQMRYAVAKYVCEERMRKDKTERLLHEFKGDPEQIEELLKIARDSIGKSESK